MVSESRRDDGVTLRLAIVVSTRRVFCPSIDKYSQSNVDSKRGDKVRSHTQWVCMRLKDHDQKFIIEHEEKVQPTRYHRVRHLTTDENGDSLVQYM